MPRRKTTGPNVLSEALGALLRLSHRVPLIGVVVALALGAGWWWLRGNPQWLYGTGKILAVALLVLAVLFLFLAAVGLARNLFPESSDARRARRSR